MLLCVWLFSLFDSSFDSNWPFWGSENFILWECAETVETGINPLQHKALRGETMCGNSAETCGISTYMIVAMVSMPARLLAVSACT